MTPTHAPDTELMARAHDDAQHADNQRRFKSLEDKLDANTFATEKIATDTADLIDLLNTVKGGLKVLGWIGGFAKWVTGLTAMFAALYAFVQNIRGKQ
jgi:hypothetical protein